MRRNFVFLFVMCMFLCINQESTAKCRRNAKVKYETQEGWSKLYSVEVQFLTGYELNDATGTFNYTVYSIYAVIFWDKNQASVIKLSTYLVCGSEVDCDCINSSFVDLEGYDQDGNKWKICVSNFCF